MTPGLVTAVLYASYLLATALPTVGAAAHQRQAAIRGATGFHPEESLAAEQSEGRNGQGIVVKQVHALKASAKG
ncbi:hypothetical protein ACFVQ9_26305 [Streptomyces goshikiensis]|uniref:hypothetical protein n=1 Tax=Streptomyces goshikiensis TaxID=1942 RepID=UPI0036982789